MTKLFRHDFTVLQGSTLTKSFTWTQDGTPVNLTAWTARMQLRTSLESPSVALELTTENGGITLGSGTGNIVLHMTATETATLADDTLVYDLELVNGATVTRKLRGTITLDKEVTR